MGPGLEKTDILACEQQISNVERLNFNEIEH